MTASSTISNLNSSRARESPAAAGNVEKVLKPPKMRTFHVRSPDDVRHALAKVMEELSGRSN